MMYSRRKKLSRYISEWCEKLNSRTLRPYFNLPKGASFLHASPIALREGMVAKSHTLDASSTRFTLVPHIYSLYRRYRHIFHIYVPHDINVTRTHSLCTDIHSTHVTRTRTFSTFSAIEIEIFTETVLRQQIVDSAFDYPPSPIEHHHQGRNNISCVLWR